MRAVSSDSAGAKPSRGRSGPPNSASVFSKDILERFRLRVLKVHRSLHDAFAPLERRCYFSMVVGMHEVRTALSRVDTEAADDLLRASNTWPAASLSTFFDALVSYSPEAAIWELGAGLTRHGIWPMASKKSLEDLSCHMQSHANAIVLETDSQFRNSRDGASRDKLLSTQELRPTGDQIISSQEGTQQASRLEDSVERFLPPCLDRASWNHFCTYLGLNLCEAKTLFFLLGDSTGVGLRTMFEAVRVTVSPEASIPRLANLAIDRYDSLRAAFHAHCSDPGSIMRWLPFLNMVRALGVPDRLAVKLWAVLVSKISLTDTNLDQLMAEAKSDGTIHEEVFVNRLAFWVPGSETLKSLKNKLRESFGDLQEARRAFRKNGVPSEVQLTPTMLGAVFRAVGITKCDSDVVLRATSKLRGTYKPLEFDADTTGGIDATVTLDDIVDVMRSQLGPRALGDEQPQSEAQALRRQLRDVRGKSSRRRRNASAPPAIRAELDSAGGQSAAAEAPRVRSAAEAKKVAASPLRASARGHKRDVGDRSGGSARSRHKAARQEGKADCDDRSREEYASRGADAAQGALRLPVGTSGADIQQPDAQIATSEAVELESSKVSRQTSKETHLVGEQHRLAERAGLRRPAPGAAEPDAGMVSADAARVQGRQSPPRACGERRRAEPTEGIITEPSAPTDLSSKAPGALPLREASASPPLRSPPLPPVHRSPPLPRMARSSTKVFPSREAGLLDSSSVERSFGGTWRPGTKARSMSPFPADPQAAGAHLDHRAPLRLDAEPPRNAWSTGSAWRNQRSTSGPLVSNSTLVPDESEAQSREPGMAKNCSNQNNDLGTLSGSITIDTVESVSQEKKSPKVDAVLIGRPWR